MAKTNQTQTAQNNASVDSKGSMTVGVPFFAALLMRALQGDFGPLAQNYYARAVSYHKGAGTLFPRPRTAKARAELTHASVQSVIERAAKGLLKSGEHEGQAVFDLMMSGAQKSAVKAK